MLRKVGRFLFSPIRHWRISLVVLIAVVIAYEVADQVLLARLAAQRESILAAGGHLSLRDFALRTDGGENAAVVYEYAASLAKETEDTGWKWDDTYDRYVSGALPACDSDGVSDKENHTEPLTLEEEARLGDILGANAKVFDALEEAYARPYCQFGHYDVPPETVATATVVVPKLPPMSLLVRLLAVRAVWEGRHGNLPGAYHWLTVGLHVANDMNNDPILLAGLFGTAGKGMIVRALNVLLCEQTLPDPIPADFLAELATAADRMKVGVFYEGERCLSDTIMATYRGMFPRPLLSLNQMASLDLLTAVISIANEPDDALHAQRVSQLNAQVGPAGNRTTRKPGFFDTLLGQHRILADILRPALGRAMTEFDRGIALARTGQVAVALKQYKQARGEYPAELGALTPDYLQDIPTDPFTGGPLTYRREGDGVVIYSVGADGRDDGGKGFDGPNKHVGLCIPESPVVGPK